MKLLATLDFDNEQNLNETYNDLLTTESYLKVKLQMIKNYSEDKV